MRWKGTRPLPPHPGPWPKETRNCQGCARSKLSGIPPAAHDHESQHDPILLSRDHKRGSIATEASLFHRSRVTVTSHRKWCLPGSLSDEVNSPCTSENRMDKRI